MGCYHCYDNRNHTGIQRPPIEPITLHIPKASQPILDQDTTAWDIVKKFATTDMTLPQAEEALKNLFGTGYVDEKWRPALTAVMNAENDVNIALKAIEMIRLSL